MAKARSQDFASKRFGNSNPATTLELLGGFFAGYAAVMAGWAGANAQRNLCLSTWHGQWHKGG